ncbi:hypothetical protein [Vulcanococcus sp.]|uniref:hypothetical protein n=1 Tax=Vulcanococcus sp. TaxID=2856995 RepID=UPI003F69C26A
MATALLIGGAWIPARADTTTAFCVLSRHDHTIPVEKGPCHFSQRQGNVTVRLNWWVFHFNADNDGKTYQRQANDVSLRFNREGEYTLTVYWQKPTP